MKPFVRIFAGLVMFGWMVMPAQGQEPTTTDLTAQINGYESAAHSSFAGVPTDWSSAHVTFSSPEPGSDAEDKAQRDPRYWLQQIRRAQFQSDDSTGIDDNVNALPDSKKPKKVKIKKVKLKKDWSVSLGATGAKVGAGFFPATFTSGSTTASCTDFVAFNTSLLGAATQASVIGLTNLYTGTCGGTVPTTAWAYNTGGTALTSIALSEDGSQLAFMQNVGTTANLVLLKWHAGPTTHVTSVTTHSNTNLTAGTFTAADVGANITGTGIPANTYITAQTGTAATISQAATGSAHDYRDHPCGDGCRSRSTANRGQRQRLSHVHGALYVQLCLWHD